MNNLRTVLEITRWEFVRWFKIRSQLITLAISIVAGLAFAGGRYLLERADSEPIHLALMNREILPEFSTAGSRITMTFSGERSEADLREAVAQRQFDGLLIIYSLDSADVVVLKPSGWIAELQALLTAERQRLKLAELRLSPEQLTAAAAPFQVGVVLHKSSEVRATLADRITSAIMIVLMLIGIFNSLAYQMVTITGEKQLRVTEQVISAVTPQQWIDGKILGISAFAMITTLVFVASTFVFTTVTMIFGHPLPIPVSLGNPAIVVVLLLVAVGGFFFWNIFLAAVAATINDPNSSSRAGMLFLPLLPSVLGGILAIKHADALWMKILTMLPITSPVVLPVRLVLSHIAWWEIAVALGLLYLSCWYLRLVAGKIFRLGILMHGKEPSLSEMLRWLREA